MRNLKTVVWVVLFRAGWSKPEATKKLGRRVVEELPPLVVASAVTACLTYPLDFARAMRMSSAADVGAKAMAGGLGRVWEKRGLFTKGLAPELAKGTASRIVKFGGYPVALALVQQQWPGSPMTLNRALAGALATVPEIALITPLEVTKLALQLDAVGTKQFSNSFRLATRTLVSAAGPTSLYCCHFGLQMRQAVWTAVYFASIPALTEVLSSTFAAGLAAGALGALVNNPIDVARSVAQKDLLAKWIFSSPSAVAMARPVPYVGTIVNAGKRVVTTKGIRGLWAGSAFKAAHLGFGGALMAVLQPACKNIWTPLLSLRGGATTGRPPVFLLAGYNPLGLKVTALGLEFIESIPGALDCDVGRLLASLKARKRRSAIKAQWLELLRFSKTGQSTRIYQNLDSLIDFAIRAGFLA